MRLCARPCLRQGLEGRLAVRKQLCCVEWSDSGTLESLVLRSETEQKPPRNSFLGFLSMKIKNTVKESFFVFACGLALMAYSLINHDSSKISWSLSPYLFPFVISIFVIVLSVTLFFGSLKSDRKVKEKSKILWKPVLSFLAAVSAYYILMPFLGFIISNILLLCGLFVLLGQKIWWKILLLSVTVTFAIYWLFHSFLHVMLP